MVLGPHIYVLGELEEPNGPVKIGMHDGSASSTGAPGMSRGNWRTLVVLHRMPVPFEDLRWHEWLIHRRLWSRHVRGEWFRARELVIDDDWRTFLDGAVEGRIHGLDHWQLESNSHALLRIKRVGDRTSPRQFDVHCTCGYTVRTGPRTALSTAQRAFALGHLSLPPEHPDVVNLRLQVHQKKTLRMPPSTTSEIGSAT